jgi:hypothetical protein
MTTPPPPGAPQPRGVPRPYRPNDKVLDILLRVVGAVVAVWGGALLGTYATFMTAYRIGTVLVPVSLVLAVVGNLALIWFAYATTGNKWLALLPGLVWAGLSFVGATRTREGDLVLYQSNWVGTVYLFAGSVTIAVAAYRLIVPKPPPVLPRK